MVYPHRISKRWEKDFLFSKLVSLNRFQIFDENIFRVTLYHVIWPWNLLFESNNSCSKDDDAGVTMQLKDVEKWLTNTLIHLLMLLLWFHFIWPSWKCFKLRQLLGLRSGIRSAYSPSGSKVGPTTAQMLSLRVLKFTSATSNKYTSRTNCSQEPWIHQLFQDLEISQKFDVYKYPYLILSH